MDELGSLVEAEILLSEQAVLEVTANFINPDCGRLATGRVVTDNLTGGVAPYFYTLNGSVSSSNPEFDNLNTGD